MWVSALESLQSMYVVSAADISEELAVSFFKVEAYGVSECSCVYNFGPTYPPE
jgi:hypothetical protein